VVDLGSTRGGHDERAGTAMLTERVIEQYRFSCVRCGKQWVDDYTAQHVTDFDGETLSFYGHGGFPCEAPAAADIVCRRCHCGPVTVALLLRQLQTRTQSTSG
jgi:hypothetical protein